MPFDVCPLETMQPHPSVCLEGASPRRHTARGHRLPAPSLTPAPARAPHRRRSRRNTTYRFFTSAMPRNAFLGIPRIWFSLRSLNEKKRGTRCEPGGRLYLHLIMITKPLGGCLGDCLVSGPRLLQAFTLFLGQWPLLKWLPGGSSLPPGRALWVVSHLQATSQAAGLFVAHTVPNSVLPPPRDDDPLSLLPHGVPSPSVGSTPLNLPRPRDSLPLSSGTGVEPGHPDFLMGSDQSPRDPWEPPGSS